MINETMSIMRDGEQDYLPIPLPVQKVSLSKY